MAWHRTAWHGMPCNYGIGARMAVIAIIILRCCLHFATATSSPLALHASFALLVQGHLVAGIPILLLLLLQLLMLELVLLLLLHAGRALHHTTRPSLLRVE